MSIIKKIMVPFDFTEPAIKALDYTLKFVGHERPIEIIALYVNSQKVTELGSEEIKNNFEQLISSLNQRTKHSPELMIAEGALTDSIISFQKKLAADLIVMGTLGDYGIEENVTNTSELVLKADCPVISVPYQAESMAPKKISLVLGKEEIENPKVLRTLLEVARLFDAEVHVLTIYQESIYSEKVVVETNENSLGYYLEHFYTEHNFEKHQDIEKGIYEYVEEKDIDLLAILPRNHAEKTSPSEGRLTKLLTLHSKVPVLTLD